jgi:hypothetical protein
VNISQEAVRGSMVFTVPPPTHTKAATDSPGPLATATRLALSGPPGQFSKPLTSSSVVS